ncbi:MAG: hypothetical protein K8S56_05855 [Candidatus Cloacimonetes bacterium]|nr:hypothetical protein [Candidatus Cloacimonadota bacterium]
METKITKLDKPTVKYIRERVKTAVSPLAEELGVMIDLGNCTFRTGNCRFQLKVAVLDPEGKPITEEMDSFRSNAKFFGFETDDLGKKVTVQGQSYTICGFNPKSSKYRIIAQSGNGKKYKFTCRSVLRALGREVPDWL